MKNHLESLESRRLLAGTGAISGSVYSDRNANARHESGEAGMKAVRVYLDANNNGAWDSRETSVLSDKRGQFRLDGLSAGTHRLREVTPANHRVSGPRSGWFKITLTEGQHVARRQFANTPVRAQGGTTSTAAAASDVLIHYTYHGDTDLNGMVNFDDYARTEDGFNNTRTGWFNGDFDYNSTVNFDDYSLIDLAFNTQAGTLGRAISYLNGSDRSSQGMSSPALQNVQEHYTQFGQDYASRFLSQLGPTSTPVAPRVLNAKEQAIADVATNVKNKTLSQAVSWLSGNKIVKHSAGVQAVIDGHGKFGIEYKREFLKVANS